MGFDGEQLEDFLRRLEQLVTDRPSLAESIASVFPAERCFDFADAADFESKARDVRTPSCWSETIKWACRDRTQHARGLPPASLAGHPLTVSTGP
jgi:hypothetical protein